MFFSVSRSGQDCDLNWEADLLSHRYFTCDELKKRSEGIKLNENKTEWRHQSGTKRPFNAVLTVLINEMNDKIGSKCCVLATESFYLSPPLPSSPKLTTYNLLPRSPYS